MRRKIRRAVTRAGVLAFGVAALVALAAWGADYSLREQIDQEQSFGGAAVGALPLGDIVYVDSVNGKNGNSGADPRHAKQTLAHALTVAQAGDTIVLNSGGSETVTATLAASTARVKIICPVSNPDSGFTVTGAGTLDLMTVSAADVEVSGLKFVPTGATASGAGILTTAAADRLTVENCVFDHSSIVTTFTGFGVEITDDCNHVVVERCRFKDCHRGVLFVTGSGKNQIDSRIRDCVFWVGQSTAFGVNVNPTGTVRGMEMTGCLFREIDGDGTAATDAWDGTDGTDATSGPIYFGANVDQYTVADNLGETALNVSFDLAQAINSGAVGELTENQTGIASDAPVTLTGDTDIDISESDYTGYTTLLTIAPATGQALTDLVIDLDWNKATTGWDTVSTAADTLDIVLLTKVDGTNWRTLALGTQVTANGDGSLEDTESGERYSVGMVHAGGGVLVKVKLSVERGDAEIPYRITYRGAAPTVTAVAAG